MSSMLKWPNKDPSDVLDYGIDFTAALDSGDTIQSATWSVSPTGLTLGGSAVASGRASIWLSGGTSGTPYTVTCHIVTTGGREMDRSARLFVTER